MLSKISVVIIAKNAQSTLRACLESVKDFDEVILLDNQSTDETQKIAQGFKNVKIYESEFIGFGGLKNLAISYARNDWILSLDSDEVLEEDLISEIKDLKLGSGIYYSFRRKNHYRGVWVKGCGWHPDWVKRIFNRKEITFRDDLVHEGLLIPKNSKEMRLNGSIKHFSFENISALLEKLQLYSSLWAIQNQHKKASPLGAMARGVWTFVRNYFFKKGFLYGYRGFVISVCNGLGAFFKYMKLYENSINAPTTSLIITTYNQKEKLQLVLDSVMGQRVLPFEVLVADDGSRQETRDLIEKYQQFFPVSLKHIWQEDCGYRLARSRNRAIDCAKGEYIIIIDGDMVLHQDFVSDHQKKAKKKCFVQGGRILLDQKESEEMIGGDYHNAFKKTSLKAWHCGLLSTLIFNLFAFRQNRISKDEFLPVRGCNMAFFKEDAMQINGFNEEFIGWGREDSEFVVRFLNNGGEMRRLKFGGIAYHLWHQENARDMLQSNHQIYLDTLNNQKKICQKGIKELNQ